MGSGPRIMGGAWVVVTRSMGGAWIVVTRSTGGAWVVVIRNMDVKMVGTSFFRRISVHSVCSVAFGPS